jgi:hypothetical protein
MNGQQWHNYRQNHAWLRIKGIEESLNLNVGRGKWVLTDTET